jgi:hypothetical protein
MKKLIVAVIAAMALSVVAFADEPAAAPAAGDTANKPAETNTKMEKSEKMESHKGKKGHHAKKHEKKTEKTEEHKAE